MDCDIVRQAEEIVAQVDAARHAGAAKRVIATLGFTGLDGVWHPCYREDAAGRWIRTSSYDQAIRQGLLPGTS